MDLKNIDLKNIKIDDLVSKIKTIDKKVLILADEKLDITKDITSRLNAKIKTLKLD